MPRQGATSFAGPVDLQDLTFRADGTIKPDSDSATAMQFQNASGTNILVINTSTPQVDLKSNNIVNLSDPTNAQDAATKNYINNATWSELGIATSDITKTDVGLGNVENVALSTATWTDMGIDETDVSASDVGLGNVENIALSTAGWTDIGISQTDVSASDVGLGSVLNVQQVPASGGSFSGVVVVNAGADLSDHSYRFLVTSDKDSGQTDVATEVRGNTTGGSVDTSGSIDSPDTVKATLGDGTTLIGYQNIGTNGFAIGHTFKLDVNGNINAEGRMSLNEKLSVADSAGTNKFEVAYNSNTNTLDFNYVG